MLKKALLAMKPLRVTKRIASLAREDTLHTIHHSNRWGSYDRKGYRYGLFLRCAIQGDVLKVAIYFPSSLRLGSSLPAYEVYIDRKEQRFLTYVRESQKWSEAKLDRLELPTNTWSSEGTWISTQDEKRVKDFLGTEKGNFAGILDYQWQIREAERVKRYQKETALWDEDLKQVPALPKDWLTWVRKVGIQENYIFYRYKKGGAHTGYCTYCEREVPISKPHYGKVGRCPRCRHKVVYKSIGKAGLIVTKTSFMYLFQRCKDGFLIREFEGWLRYPKGQYKNPELSTTEIRRVIFSPNARHLRAYAWGLYKQHHMRWVPTGACSPGWYGEQRGRVYGKTLPSLAKNELSRTGLPEMIAQAVIDPEKYLSVLAHVPILEQLSKAKLPGMALECVQNYYEFVNRFPDNGETSLTKRLGIDQQELKRLREHNGNLRYLDWLRYEKACGKPISDAVIAWFCQERITASDLKFIWSKMSAAQVRNYVQRQMRDSHMTSGEVLTTWADYLSMAKRFGMDTDDEIVFRVKKLKQRHDALARRGAGKDLTLRAGQILLKFPHVEEICKAIKKKFEYGDDTYQIVVPQRIEDILREGDKLCHCIANSERYWERMEKGESYLLFLRKAKAPSTPYYTLEVEPDGTVRQIRTFYDRQGKDIEAARAFLKAWQKEVGKRLNQEDRKKANASRVLREQEFQQMREDNVLIRTGELAGHRLVDVLTADLMETAA